MFLCTETMVQRTSCFALTINLSTELSLKCSCVLYALRGMICFLREVSIVQHVSDWSNIGLYPILFF